MKIFFDYKIFFQQEYGGPSNYFVNLVRELNVLKCNAKIFAPIHINLHLQKSNNIFFNFNFFIKKNFFIKYLNFINFIFTKFFMHFFRPQIYHTTYYGYNINRSRIPMVVTVYDLIHEIYSKTYYKKLLSTNFKKKILEKSQHIICISKNTQKDLIKYYNVNIEKTSVVYLGKYEDNTLLNNQNIFKPFFLYVGNRHRYKNFKILLKAYSQSKILMENVDLICFGGGNFTEEEKNSMFNYQIPFNNIIHLEGEDKILVELYQKAVALIYPSLYEGFGIPLVDAMHQGCPLIVSRKSCFPEICQNSALYFDPLSINDLINMMNTILFNKKIRNNLIVLGKERANYFSWHKCAKETLNIYKNIV